MAPLNLFLSLLIPLVNLICFPLHGHAHTLSSSEVWASTYLARLHKLLIDVPSVTGTEHRIGIVLEDQLRSLGLIVERQFVTADRFNIYAYFGARRRTSILLSSHIDTVPPFYGYEIRDAQDIWGRGSVDAKASIAAMIQAFLNLKDAGNIEKGDLGLMFVVGEETDGRGMREVNKLKPHLQWDTVIFGEPTEGKLACGHKGLAIAKLTVHGKAAHSGYPELGVNALALIVRILDNLLETRFPSDKMYGDTTFNIGLVNGGSAANVVADRAEAEFSLRLAAGHVEGVKQTVETVVSNITGENNWEIEWSGNAYGPQDCLCDVQGFEKTAVNYGTDIPNLEGDHDRYLYGPGSILVAHSDHEHILFHELELAVAGYEKIVRHALKKKRRESDQIGL
ncbi:MAG: hypothetical protein M1814_003965 [Vezdaea aestivalis]|nr:MAG: hypothetical protein M1814_003965 [Vezdaea aestivalis]